MKQLFKTGTDAGRLAGVWSSRFKPLAFLAVAAMSLGVPMGGHAQQIASYGVKITAPGATVDCLVAKEQY